MYYNTDIEPETLKFHRRKGHKMQISTSGNHQIISKTEGVKRIRTKTNTEPELNFNSKSTNDLKLQMEKRSAESGHQLKLSPPKTGIPEIKSPILMKNFNLPGVKKNSYVKLF